MTDLLAFASVVANDPVSAVDQLDESATTDRACGAVGPAARGTGSFGTTGSSSSFGGRSRSPVVLLT